ncbi:hypothetical protein Hdeb2414_s0001g00010051 [Helianthus debilis subsp. tardiflorus]
MSVVHFELSCVAVSGELSIPLFCMFYKLIYDEDWFTFTKRKDNISQLLRSLRSMLLGLVYDVDWFTSSRIRDKTPEVSAAHVTPAFEISPLHATGTSKPSHLEGFASRSPLVPLFADALPVPYVPKWNIAQSTVVGTPETARDFLAHVVPPSHRFMNSYLRADLFDDQYSMSLCEGFFRGVGMLQRVDELRKENEGLRGDHQTS